MISTSPGWLSGLRLHGVSFRPPRSSAALLVLHGIGEHGGRYQGAMRHLAEREVACFVYDQRGHGLSPGPRADVERFSLLVEDATRVAMGIRRENPGLPLFMWGHSMGSVVAVLAAAAPDLAFSGVVTSGCPLDAFARTMRWLLPLLQLTTRAAPGLRISGIFSAADLSHDPLVQRAYEEDPLVEHKVTLRLIAGIAGACREARDVAPGLHMPWLAVHGTEDRIAPPSGSRHLTELLGSRDKQLIRYPGLRHEIHNEMEPDRTRFLETFAQWMIDRRTR